MVENKNQHCSNMMYNCYTFAFNIPDGSWGRPYNVGCDMDQLIEQFYNVLGIVEEEVISETVLQAIEEYLLENHGSLRVLDTLDVDLETEEIIQLRVGLEFDELDIDDDDDYEKPYMNSNFDFHFKVFRNGKWQEKCGSSSIISCTPWTDKFNFSNEEDDNRYTSRTITFANKIN